MFGNEKFKVGHSPEYLPLLIVVGVFLTWFINYMCLGYNGMIYFIIVNNIQAVLPCVFVCL